MCELICCETVCSLLGLSQLFEVKDMEHACLRFMGSNLSQVVSRLEFGSMQPSSLLAFNRHLAQVDESRKRKRGA